MLQMEKAMDARIGVYICNCGTNVAENVDVELIAKQAAGLPDVVAAKTHNLLCSEDGKAFLENEILSGRLDRVVVAACSPRQHEPTFQKVCLKAGLNPFLMQMTNIRELCSWVTPDRAAATDKAAHLVRAAVARVKMHVPLETPEVECCPDALVIGAGVAGIEAALLLAQKGRKVVLVEKTPCIGGMVTRYEEVFPTMECATCMLEPKMDEILHNDNIELLTLSEVEEVLGFFGNFTVRIRRKARYVDPANCFGCNACLEPCPVKVDDEYNEGLNKRGAIYVPYAGALPNVPAIDRENCLRFQGKECSACADACGFGAIVFDQEDEIIERKVGGFIVASGAGVFDCSALPDLGYRRLDNVVTALELERMVSSTGHTGGKIVLKNGEPPKRVAFIHCVGSRSKSTRNYCSAVCCMTGMKLARNILHKLDGNVAIQMFHSDLCIPGELGQEFLDGTADAGIKFVRVGDMDGVKIEAKNKELAVSYSDSCGAGKIESADLVVLLPAIVPGPDTEQISKLFSIDVNKRGFFAETHGHLDPVSTPLNGMFIAGCAQGPADVRTSVLQGKAAAGEILSALVPGEKLEVETITTFIDGEMCSGCRCCNALCPYKAISFDEEKKISIVNEVLCRGCGTCAAACPSGAAHSKYFENIQIMAEIEGVLA
jgi:heterodisulfide reductase subunit A2